MQNSLRLNSVSCGYGSEFQLLDIDFTLNRGILAGIIGPNGSGKTTLFRGIAGDLKLRNGSVILGDKDMGEIELREKAKSIAVVSQFIEKTHISVEDYVLLGRIPYRNRFQFFESKQDIEIAKKYMKLTEVYPLRHKLMSQLSGGEQQLVDIARALTQEPKVLLLDEPTSHLDITHQVQILNLIQQLSSDLDLTVLMIIHDLNLAGEYCDFLLMMNNGSIYTKGTPDEVLTFKNIEEVYKTVVIVQPNPLSKKPAIFQVSNKVLLKNKMERK